MTQQQTTPLSQLLGKDEGPQRPMQMPSQDPSGQFANLPRMGGVPVDARAATSMMPTGVGQGFFPPEPYHEKNFSDLRILIGNR